MTKATVSRILVAIAFVLFMVAAIVGHIEGVGAHDLAYFGLACLAAAHLIP